MRQNAGKQTKDEILRIRMEKDIKDIFFKMCADRAISPSKLIRLLIDKWIVEKTRGSKTL